MTIPEKRLPALWLEPTTLSKWNNEQLDCALKASEEIWISDFIKRLNYAVEDLADNKVKQRAPD
jgi:hypothetical protein